MSPELDSWLGHYVGQTYFHIIRSFGKANAEFDYYTVTDPSEVKIMKDVNNSTVYNDSETILDMSCQEPYTKPLISGTCNQNSDWKIWIFSSDYIACSHHILKQRGFFRELEVLAIGRRDLCSSLVFDGECEVQHVLC